CGHRLATWPSLIAMTLLTQIPDETDNEIDSTDKHWLLWDGECGFCRRSAAWVRSRDSRGVFEIVPYQDAPSPLMTPEIYENCPNAVHVVTNRGVVLRAGRATVYIFDQLGYKLVRVLLYPPIIWLVEIGYRIVASNRNLFAKVMFRHE